MGFFDFLGGRSKGKLQAVSLKPEEAEPFLEKELAHKKKRALDESARRIAEIKHTLKELDASLKALEGAKAPEKSARLDRIVETSRSNSLRQLSSLLEKLKPTNSSDLGEIKRYCSESLLALQQAGHFGRNIAYAGISFKEEMKSIGTGMKQLSEQIVSLKKILDENSAVFSLPLLKQKMLQFRNASQSIEFAEKDLLELQRRLAESSEENAALGAKLNALRKSDEFSCIAEFNLKKSQLLKEKQSAKTELLNLFARVERPLSRLDKATKAGKVFLQPEQATFLHELLVNPFMALKLDPKAETTKAILAEAKKAIETGLIELKAQEKEKKLAAIQELLSFDFFSEIFWKFNKIDSELLAIEKKLKETVAAQKEAELSSLLQESEESIKGMQQQIEAKKSKIDSSKSGLLEIKKSISEIISGATGKQVLLEG